MQKIVILLGVGVLVITGIWFLAAGPMMNRSGTGVQGRVVFSVTDAAVALENIQSVNITITKAEVQSAEKGWVSVSNKSQVFDLLTLKNSNALALLADVNLDAGAYNQIRLTVSKVEVTQAGKVNVAKLPSNDLKIVGSLIVDANSTSSAVLDFLVDKSLHITGNGQFVFAPVVRLIAKSQTEVTVDAKSLVNVSGTGKIDSDTTVGMNEKGETKENFEINANAKVEVNAGGTIIVNGAAGAGVQTGLGPVTFNLSAQNSSGMSGKATVIEVDGRAQVKVELSGTPLGLPQPAHVHVGSCAGIGAVKYPLSNVVSGNSTTVLSVSMADLKAGLPLAINVHKSIAEPGVYVACGDLSF
jgi:hypothetical protein